MGESPFSEKHLPSTTLTFWFKKTRDSEKEIKNLRFTLVTGLIQKQRELECDTSHDEWILVSDAGQVHS